MLDSLTSESGRTVQHNGDDDGLRQMTPEVQLVMVKQEGELDGYHGWHCTLS